MLLAKGKSEAESPHRAGAAGRDGRARWRGRGRRRRRASELCQAARAVDEAGHHPTMVFRSTCIQRPRSSSADAGRLVPAGVPRPIISRMFSRMTARLQGERCCLPREGSLRAGGAAADGEQGCDEGVATPNRMARTTRDIRSSPHRRFQTNPGVRFSQWER
jgi:hypothetical protein